MSDILYYAPGSSTVIDHNFKQDQEIERLRSQLAEAEEELAQWRATGESVTRNEHDLAARLADIEAQNRVMWDVANDREARLAEAEALRKDAERYREWRRAFRDGECGLYNALCDAGSEAEHDAAIDAALQERKP